MTSATIVPLLPLQQGRSPGKTTTEGSKTDEVTVFDFAFFPSFAQGDRYRGGGWAAIVD